MVLVLVIMWILAILGSLFFIEALVCVCSKNSSLKRLKYGGNVMHKAALTYTAAIVAAILLREGVLSIGFLCLAVCCYAVSFHICSHVVESRIKEMEDYFAEK